MVEPLAFWMSLNSCVKEAGMVISAFISLPLSRKSRAVIILVRLAMYRCWSEFWRRMGLPVSRLKRYTDSVSLTVWMGIW